MTMQQVCTLGLLVLRHIEQCFVVCSPDDIVNPLSGIRQKGSRAKVFDMQLVLAKTDIVCRISEKIIVIAHLHCSDRHELLPGGKCIHIEKHLFRRSK